MTIVTTNDARLSQRWPDITNDAIMSQWCHMMTWYQTVCGLVIRSHYITSSHVCLVNLGLDNKDCQILSKTMIIEYLRWKYIWHHEHNETYMWCWTFNIPEIGHGPIGGPHHWPMSHQLQSIKHPNILQIVHHTRTKTSQ